MLPLPQQNWGKGLIPQIQLLSISQKVIYLDIISTLSPELII